MIEKLATFIPQQPKPAASAGFLSKARAGSQGLTRLVSKLGNRLTYVWPFVFIGVIGFFVFSPWGGHKSFTDLLKILGAFAGTTFGGVRAWQRLVTTKRDRKKIEQEIRRRLETGESDFEKVEKAVLDAVGAKGDVSVKTQLVREGVQRFLENESEVQREAEAEVVKYLPPLPRNAKRMLNRLRLLLFVAHERKVFGGQPELKARHIGKWAVLGERWPELAQALAFDPAGMSKLEIDAADRSKFGDSVKALAPVYATDDDLRSFCQSETKLGEVMERLIRFEPAS